MIFFYFEFGAKARNLNPNGKISGFLARKKKFIKFTSNHLFFLFGLGGLDWKPQSFEKDFP